MRAGKQRTVERRFQTCNLPAQGRLHHCQIRTAAVLQLLLYSQ